MKMNASKLIEEDLIIRRGIGATMSCGSDCYPYYVSETLSNGVIGIYAPASRFDKTHPWEGGVEVVDDFDPDAKADVYIRRQYGHWWKCTKDGKRLAKFTDKWHRLNFGHAYAYSDPSF